MKNLVKSALSMLAAVGLSHNANAILTFDLNTALDFSGDQPDGNVIVSFESQDADTVRLTITSGLVSPENMAALYLNLNSSYNPASLSFSQVSKSGSFTDPSITTGTNAFKADGDGFYDILFDFAPPGTRFDNADSVVYDITRLAGLVEADFNYLSAPGGGHGPFFAAAHIQNTDGPEGSGWIRPNGNAVPDTGSTVMLLGGALSALGMIRRRVS